MKNLRITIQCLTFLLVLHSVVLRTLKVPCRHQQDMAILVLSILNSAYHIRHFIPVPKVNMDQVFRALYFD